MSSRPIPAQTRRGEPVLIFRVGGHRFLIPSGEIAEVRDLHAGGLPPFILLRGSVKQAPVIAADRVFGLRPAGSQQLLILGNRGIAVAIDRIEGVTEIVEIVALPRAFHGEERRWYRGLALLNGQILPVVNAAAFAEFARANAAPISEIAKGSAETGRLPSLKASPGV